MNYEYDLVEKFELHTTPPEDGNRLIKTWRSSVLLKGNDASLQYSLGELCEEIVLDTIANVRIGGERMAEECDPHDKNLSKLFRLLVKSQNELSTQAYALYEKAQSDKKCAELNGPTMLRVQQDLRDILRLPPEISNNSTNTSLRIFLKNVLHLFAQWFKKANLALPADVEERLFRSGPSSPPKEADRIRFQRICEEKNLQKGVKIELDDLYDIGMHMFSERMPPWNAFKHDRMMKYLRYLASRTDYAVKRGDET